jgi:DNA-binding NarL/FixJ family response regulator
MLWNLIRKERKNALDSVLAKNNSTGDLIKSLELISSGRIIISPLFAERFLEDLAAKNEEPAALESKPASILSERELDIARLISQGATNREIASELFIAENTVKVHVKNILAKLELKNRQQLAVYAAMKEWIKINPETEKTETGSGS